MTMFQDTKKRLAGRENVKGKGEGRKINAKVKIWSLFAGGHMPKKKCVTAEEVWDLYVGRVVMVGGNTDFVNTVGEDSTSAVGLWLFFSVVFSSCPCI